MHKKSKLMTILFILILAMATTAIYLQMTNSKIKISEKQMQSKGEKVAIEAKSTKDCNVKLYQKTEDENEFTEVKTKVENQGILSTKSTFELDTKDTSKPNNVTNIKPVITDDYIIISFTPATDNATLYEYYLETQTEGTNSTNAPENVKSDVTKIYSDSGIKGYNYIIDNSKDTEAGLEVNKTNDEPILYTGIEWDKDYYLHIRAIDNSGNYSNNITYKIDLPSKGVMLKYIDLNTKTEISPEETIIGIVNEKYNISSFNKDISGFKLVGIDGETEGKLKKERINVKYNYAKNASITVKYVDKTGAKLLEPTVIDGYEGKEYSIYPKKIDGYVCEMQNLNGKMNAGDEERVLTYNKLGTVTTSYVNEITGENIENDVVITSAFGQAYKTEEKSIEGYELSKVEGETEGIINSDNISVTYYYKKKVNMKVKYVDITTNKLLDEEVINGLEGDKVEVKAKEFDGYVLTLKENSLNENKGDLIKNGIEYSQENTLIEKSKIQEEEVNYEASNETDDETNLDTSNIDSNENEYLAENEKTNIVEELLAGNYENDEGVEKTEETSNEHLEEYNIKQEYDIVLDPKETEYIIYYRKK